SERCGVSHLVHCWPEQGQKRAAAFHPSRDMLRNASGTQAVEWYFQHTVELAIALDAMFKVSFPNDYEIYEEAFKAGRWIQADPGPWLGRAIVWKLQVLPHRDKLDAGPTAIFNLGRYEGGEAYFTDLKLKLKYGPGDVIIFLSGDLYHGIGEWKPLQGLDANNITPGRIGNVFFSPAASVEFLKGHEEGWFKSTMGGQLP
ncbi:hypothetical protein EV424DRAFT_1305306, partial [Suillus variegatus]